MTVMDILEYRDINEPFPNIEAGNPGKEENIPFGLDALDNLFKEKVK